MSASTASAPSATIATNLTPMLRQYLEIKAVHPEEILLYRMGDFFELFYDDAVRAAPILEVQLTARNRGTANESPMCGVPHHAIESYIAKLLAAGLRVAICDQVEDPAQAKGLVRREVTRIVTPGTISSPDLLHGNEDNYLASIAWAGEQGAAAFLDVSTGAFFIRRFASVEEAVEQLAILAPREALFEEGTLPRAILDQLERECPCRTPLDGDRRFDPRRAAELLTRHFGTASLRGFGLDEREPAVLAAAAALAYGRETQRNDLAHVRHLAVREPGDRLIVDATTLQNLEVFASQRAAAAGTGRRKATLLGVLDRTASPPGGRTLRDWLARPLSDPAAISARHVAVGELVADEPRRERIRAALARLGDPERVLARAVLGTMSPREAAALREGLRAAAEALAEISAGVGPSGSLLDDLAATDPLPTLWAELVRRLEEAPASTPSDGAVIAAGVDPELDRYRSLARDSKQHILAVEQRERERTGIPSLKIRYNRVFGYYLEITHSNSQKVPPDYIRKQTLVNAERYITPEIKELEEQILSADERRIALEQEHFRAILALISASAEGLSQLARSLGALDALAAFAEVAARGRYVRPQMTAPGGIVRVREGRHPVVEPASREAFVPNDADLDPETEQIVLLTGPNMGGKSTYLRQVALIVLMAQAGSWVPADSAEISVCDRIFSRVGASDDLARGESTFMVEMIETANILRHATDRSLVILDEVGRGTATFDGLSLAWAIVEHLHQHGRSKVLFATHYHELTELAELLPRVINRTMAVREWDEKIIFLRRVVSGSADKSYGIHVARLAGLPNEVVVRAAEVLANLEAHEYDLSGKPRLAKGAGAPVVSRAPDPQMSLFAPPVQVVAEMLAAANLDQMTPLAALNLLHSLKGKLGS
ncbi:MAG: DNA mismatch repair protein MutS [Acidobacteriota bacterium]